MSFARSLLARYVVAVLGFGLVLLGAARFAESSSTTNGNNCTGRAIWDKIVGGGPYVPSGHGCDGTCLVPAGSTCTKAKVSTAQVWETDHWETYDVKVCACVRDDGGGHLIMMIDISTEGDPMCDVVSLWTQEEFPWIKYEFCDGPCVTPPCAETDVTENQNHTHKENKCACAMGG